MSSQLPRVDSSPETGAERLRLIAEKIDLQQFPQPRPGLILLPESPGRVQASWSIEPGIIARGREVLGIPAEQAELVLRTYEFSDSQQPFEHAHSWEDFPVEGLENSGYFNLSTIPEFVGGVIGLKNGMGQFRPLIRANAVALPQPPSPPPLDSEAAQAEPPSAARESPETKQPAPQSHAVSHSLDEAAILSRLPALEALPEELRASPEVRLNAELAKAFPPSALNPAAIHETALARDTLVPESLTKAPGQLAIGSHGQATTSTHAANARPTDFIGTSELAGASEQLASQWAESDQWPIQLRAELVVQGRVAPDIHVSIGGYTLKSLPGGQFRHVRELTGLTEVWPLFSALSAMGKSARSSVTLAQTVKGGRPLLEMHTSITIEGRIQDSRYHHLLPDGITPGPDGRFKITQALPDGAVLLPGFSLIAQA